jgi:hypothetical protein
VTAFDAHYSRVVNVDPAVAAADPKRFQPVGDQRVKMLDPSGKTYTLPASSAQDAANKGWTWHDDAAAAHEARVDFYREHYGGAFQVGAHEALNQLSGGVQGELEKHELPPELQEAYEAENKEHRVAQVVGGGVGALGLTAATAGLGEALQGGHALAATAQAVGKADGARMVGQAVEAAAPGLTQRMAAATGRAALEGAAWSAPQAVTQAAFGDYDQAAESVLWGVGTGGLLGLGHGAFSEAANATRSAIGETGGKLLGAAKEHGLVGENGALDLSKLGIATPEKAAEARAAATRALGEHASILDKAIGDLPGKERAAVDKLAVVPTDLADKVGSTLADAKPGLTLPGFANPEAKQTVEAAVKKIADLGNQPLSFGKLQELRSSLLEGGLGSSERARVLRQIDQIVEAEQSRAMAQTYNALPLKTDYPKFLADLAAKQNALGAANALGAPSMAQQWLAGKAVGAVSKAASGAIGGGIGGAIAGPAGAWLGTKAVSPLIGRVLDHVLTPKALDLSGAVLQKIAKSAPEISAGFGVSLAKNAADAAAKKIGTVSRALRAGVADSAPVDAIKGYLGRKANGLSKAQQYDKLNQSLTQAAANPDQVTQEAAHLSSIFGEDPRLAALVAQKAQAQIAYLHQALPKDPKDPQAFNKRPWSPSFHERAAFERRLEVAQNPWAVMDHVQRGDLRAEHVEALQTLYPALHDSFVGEVAKMAHDPSAPPISAGVRHGLSLLTGVQLTAPAGANYQGAYQNVEPQQQAAPGPKKAKGHKVNVPSLQTSSQRLQFK